jgi:hypothetical protein
MSVRPVHGPMLSADDRSEAPLSMGTAMGWLFLASSLVWPRVVILAFWIFGSQLGDAFRSWVVPALGFLLAPWTTMTYALMWGLSSDRVSGIEWLFVAIAVLFDIATWLSLGRVIRGLADNTPR